MNIFKLWCFHWKELVHIHQDKPYSKLEKNVVLSIKIDLCVKNVRLFLQGFFKITFKVHQFYKLWWLYRKNHIKIYQTISRFYLKKDLHLILKGIISSEKMRNSGNYNCNYAHSFFDRIFSPSRFTGKSFVSFFQGFSAVWMSSRRPIYYC